MLVGDGVLRRSKGYRSKSPVCRTVVITTRFSAYLTAERRQLVENGTAAIGKAGGVSERRLAPLGSPSEGRMSAVLWDSRLKCRILQSLTSRRTPEPETRQY